MERLIDGGEFIGVQIGRSGVYDSTDYFKTYYHEFPDSSPVVSIVSSTESSLDDRLFIKPQHTIKTDLSPNVTKFYIIRPKYIESEGSRRYEDEVGKDRKRDLSISDWIHHQLEKII